MRGVSNRSIKHKYCTYGIIPSSKCMEISSFADCFPFLLVMLDIELSSDSDDDVVSVTDDRPPGSGRWALVIYKVPSSQIGSA